ncbi:hypothetical protein ACFLS7_04415 [Bacteroidota bacterium]
MKRKGIWLMLLVLSLIIQVQVSGQEFNYWTQQAGTVASMLGGAVTAAPDDNSAMFYNPGALGFAENSTFSISSAGFFFNWITMKNAIGDNTKLNFSTLDALPQLVSASINIPKNPLDKTAYGILNRQYSNINFSFRNQFTGKFTPGVTNDQVYVGIFTYFNRSREDWAGFAMAKQLTKELGIGLSTYLSFRTQELAQSTEKQLYDTKGNPNLVDLYGVSTFSQNFKLFDMGLILQFGTSYQREKLKLGFTVTFPFINIRLFHASSLNRTYITSVNGVDSLSSTISVWQDKVKSTYKTPFIIDFGGEFHPGKSTVLFAKVSLFTKVKKYALLKTGEKSNVLSSHPLTNEGELSNLFMANRFLVNGAVAIQQTVAKGVLINLGFRTDFNYLDRGVLDADTSFTPGISTWDIYHISSGVIVKMKKIDLNVGLSYSFGNETNLTNYFDLNDPTLVPAHSLSSTRGKAAFNQIGLLLGFTYYFSNM